MIMTVFITILFQNSRQTHAIYYIGILKWMTL